MRATSKPPPENLKKLNKHNEIPVVVYSPESQMRTPGRLLRSLWSDFKSGRELSWRLFVRDISAQYRQSLLGIFWAFLPPVATGLVFIILQSKKVVNFAETSVPYPVFVLVGTTLWQTFVESLNAPLKSVITAKPMLAKVNFPRESLIVSAFYQSVFNFLIKCFVLLGVFIYFHVPVTWSLLLAPMAILMLILLGITIGLFLTPIGVLYGDIQTGLVLLVQFWFFATPVVYPPPQSFPYSLLAVLNPVSPLLMTSRELILGEGLSNLWTFSVASCLTLWTLIIGLTIYRLALPIIIERMSA